MALIRQNFNTKKEYIAAFILALFIPFASYLNAQVTIGSTEVPVAGALLDLKSAGVTSKGLGMPRVILNSLTITDEADPTNLAPTVAGSEAETWDKDEHIGLLVYHAGEYDECDPYSIRQGMYVWTGNEWQFIGRKLSEFVDTRDGSVYHYRSFGDAGEWMLENMRYIVPGMPAKLMGDDETDQCYTYPNPDTSDPGKKPDTWRLNQGLLYSYAAITLGAQDAVEDDQGQGSDTEGPVNPIQGICPPGWHVPSDREWNELEKEIYNNADKYSEYTRTNGQLPFAVQEWLPNWDIEFDQGRGSHNGEGHGLAMLSACAPIGSTPPVAGKSLSAAKGGFDALPVGMGEELYGIITIFASSSSSADASYIWGRLISLEENSDTQLVTRSNMGLVTLYRY